MPEPLEPLVTLVFTASVVTEPMTDKSEALPATVPPELTVLIVVVVIP